MQPDPHTPPAGNAGGGEKPEVGQPVDPRMFWVWFDAGVGFNHTAPLYLDHPSREYDGPRGRYVSVRVIASDADDNWRRQGGHYVLPPLADDAPPRIENALLCMSEADKAAAVRVVFETAKAQGQHP